MKALRKCIRYLLPMACRLSNGRAQQEYDWLMADSKSIKAVVLAEDRIVVTLIDGTFLLLTLDQLLNLGVTRHRIPADMLTMPAAPAAQ